MGAGRSGDVDDRHELRLRELAMVYPGAVEDFPWGHRAIKAGKPSFLFMGTGDDGLSLTVKLPHSGREALLLPFTEPTGYGMAKHGWVTARFPPGETPPLALLAEWLEESYRAVAPKRLVAELDARAVRGRGDASGPGDPRRRRRKA